MLILYDKGENNMSPEQEWETLATIKKLKQDVKDLRDELERVWKALDDKEDRELFL